MEHILVLKAGFYDEYDRIYICKNYISEYLLLTVHKILKKYPFSVFLYAQADLTSCYFKSNGYGN
jgi:hypothetical protein